MGYVDKDGEFLFYQPSHMEVDKETVLQSVLPDHSEHRSSSIILNTRILFPHWALRQRRIEIVPVFCDELLLLRKYREGGGEYNEETPRSLMVNTVHFIS
jgi:hypothetical protein